MLNSSQILARDKMIDIYRRSNLIYQVDAKLCSMIKSGEIQTIYYSPRGQEILAAALMAALRPDDYLVTTYRGIHDQIAKGIPIKDLLSEFTGKATGTCKGKGGPMHVTHPDSGVMVTTGIVGSGMPIANGLALASQLEEDGRVTVVCFGDAATNIGAFHESLNLAQIWKLPVVFVCQNNLYGEHTPFSMSTDCKELVDRGPAYGINAIQVNGNDAFEMYAAAETAIQRARSGAGPTFIEAKTFRFCGHLLGDESHYIPKAEMDAAKNADPVKLYREALIGKKISEAELELIEKEISEQIEEAMEAAVAAPYPDTNELRFDVLQSEIVA